ncbi:MAG: hypothetical protein ABI624_06595 [Casimicrobiaceae bacterium]
MADGLRLVPKHNLDEVFAKMEAYSQAIQERATEVALNKLGDQARVVGQRAIRKTYGIGIEELGKYMDFIPAGGGRLEFVIVAVGKGFPMSLFKPRVVRGPGGGVSVLLKGRRVLIRHAFMFNGQVYARGTYNAGSSSFATTGKGAGKRRKRGIRELTGRSAFEATGERLGHFAYGRNRFPITLLRSTTPPAALLNPDVVDAMNARIQEQAPNVIKNAIKFATSGG